MKLSTYPRFLLAAVLLLLAQTALSQQLQISATSTRSICFNDGNIYASASGGALPYTFSITAGPGIAGMVYPLAPTNNVDAFLSIPAGNYTLQVVDGAGNSAQTVVVVQGNYQFPLLTTTVLNGHTIVANVSRGRPPYTYAISPVASNGPFGPQQTSNRFDTLCNGIYYVRVTDSCQNIFTTPGIVISRPRIEISNISCTSVTDSTHSISVGVYSYTGTPPYTYRCYNSGNMQVNNTGNFNIQGTCPDSIVVTDRCGVWDTMTRDCAPYLYGRTICSDCIVGTVIIAGEGGTPPYTYVRSTFTGTPLGASNQTGVFTGLPPSGSYYFRITDACGRRVFHWSPCLTVSSSLICPFNNDVVISVSGDVQFPVTLTCTSCNPVRTVTTSSGTVIMTGLSPGFHNFTATDTCGVPVPRVILVDTGAISLNTTWRSCNDVSFTAFNSMGTSVTPSTVFVLTGTGGFTQTNTTGRFDNLPDGNYTLRAEYPMCEPRTTSISVPHLPSFCNYPTFDNQCNPAYDLRLQTTCCTYDFDLPERLSFVSTTGTFTQVESPPQANNGSNFNDLPVGNYNLVSDSGCSILYILPAHPVVNLTAYDSVDCLDQQFLFARIQPDYLLTTPCSDSIKFTFRAYSQNGALLSTTTNGNFIVPDTGNYIIKAFYRVTDPFSYPQVPYTNNDLCFVDSVHIKARARTLPKIFARDTALCFMSIPISVPYDITGGIPPYTLLVPGRGVFAVQGNSGMLNSLTVNNYTLIAYDDCGISNSLTISVIDTCYECSNLSSFLPLDSQLCAGTVVRYTDTSQYATQYQWYVNGIMTSTLDVLVYRFDTAGVYTITNIAANISCVDTTSRTVYVTSINGFSLGNDTAICSNDSVTINPRAGNLLWSNNITAPAITVSQPGLYWASSGANCGNFYDTIEIGHRSVVPPSLGPDHSLCVSDSFPLNAGANTYTGYLWQNGSRDSLLMAYAPGLYWVEVISNGCRLRDSLQILPDVPPPYFSLGNDSALCDTVIALLQTPYSYTVWSTGDTASQIIVSDAGLYWAKAENGCGSHLDSVYLRVIPTPVFTWVSDTFICDNSSYVLYAQQGVDSVRWFDGTTGNQKEVAVEGTYWITYFKEMCRWNDSVNVTNIATPHLVVAPEVIECGDAFDIHAGIPGVYYVWSDGSADSVLHVTQSGIYTVTAANNCGSDSASINVLLMGSDCRMAIPTAFTPNRDGKNDEFKVLSLCEIKQFTLHIYNRWGEIIYESNDAQQGWNGFFKDELQPGGTYIVYMSYFDDCAQAISYVQSSVTLLH